MNINHHRALGFMACALSAVFVLWGLCAVAHAGEPTRAAVARAVDPAFKKSSIPWVAVAVAAVADIATTEAALHRGCHEANPIYGTHPSVGELVALHAMPLAFLWPHRKNKWLYAPAVLLGAIAIHNATIQCRG